MSGPHRGRRTLAFDLDGTLVDCRARQLHLAETLVPALDGDAFWTLKRDGRTTRAALEALGHDPVAAVAWGARIEDDLWLRRDAILPGAREAIALTRRAGLRVLVVTARRRPGGARAVLVRVGLIKAIDDLRCVDPTDAADQKAAVLRETGAVGLVGDTESDAAAADAAGVPFAAVGCGQRSPAFLGARGLGPVHAHAAPAARSLLAHEATAAALRYAAA